MSRPNGKEIDIKPEDDARLPSLIAEIESEWRAHRKPFVKRLLAAGTLVATVRETALDCIRIYHQYEERGLGADQAREVARELIFPRY